MVVSKMLGHSSYVLTLTTYADYIDTAEVEKLHRWRVHEQQKRTRRRFYR